MSLQTFYRVGVLVLVLSTIAFAQDTCIMTPTSCQCSSRTPSGTCLRSQGDGTCLLGLCNEGHRCDCFGYEMCSIASCGKHVPMGNAVLSESVAFQCRMSPATGQCTSVVDFTDTLLGADNAEADATSSNDDATSNEVDGTRQVVEIQVQKKVINEALRDLERLADDIPDEELESIESDAVAVSDAIEDAALIMVESVKDAQKAAGCLLDSRRFRRDARNKERLAKEKEDVVKNEEAKKERKDNNLIKRLTGEIKELKDERKASAKMCGKKAKEAKEWKKSCGKKTAEAKKLKERALRSGSSCMGKAQKSLGKAGARLIA